MSQSLSAVYLHLVFSTKGRHPFLRDAVVRTEMHAYLGGVAKTLDSPTLIVGGTEDHVHILSRMGRAITQADLVKELKRVSSGWIKERDAALGAFAWQLGYGTFSVSTSNVEAVCDYIRQQEEHHRTLTFQEEYRAFLEKHGIEWKERYVWD